MHHDPVHLKLSYQLAPLRSVAPYGTLLFDNIWAAGAHVPMQLSFMMTRAISSVVVPFLLKGMWPLPSVASSPWFKMAVSTHFAREARLPTQACGSGPPRLVIAKCFGRECLQLVRDPGVPEAG